MRRYREDSERLVKKGNYWVRRPHATPYHATWQEYAVDAAKDASTLALVIGLLAANIVLLALFLGVPFLLWVIAS